MEFSVGDGIVHPGHGAGTIIDVEQINFVEGFQKYYVIEMIDRDMTLRIPIKNTDALGIRPVAQDGKLKRIMETLKGAPEKLAKDYKKRRAALEKKLKTGTAIPMAEIVRDLAWRQHQDNLSPTDNKLLDKSRNFLASEIAVASNTDPDAALLQINEALDMMKGHQEMVKQPV